MALNDITIFEQLCKKYSAKREREIDFARLAGQGAIQFASNVQRYFGIPDQYFYVRDESGQETGRKYIDISLASEDWKETSRNFHSLKDMFFDKNGFLRFYLIIALEEEENSKIKLFYHIHCGIRPISKTESKIFVGSPDENSTSKEFIWTNGKITGDGPEQYVLDTIISFLDKEPFLDIPLSVQP